VLDMMKNNPKIDLEESAEGILSFQYRAKYEIRSVWQLLVVRVMLWVIVHTSMNRNKHELLRVIERVKTGVLLSDIEDCYPDLGM
jgi:hypothetical protein